MPMSHFGRVADTSKRYTVRKDQSGGGRFSSSGVSRQVSSCCSPGCCGKVRFSGFRLATLRERRFTAVTGRSHDTDRWRPTSEST
jgi:hypothetical protein